MTSCETPTRPRDSVVPEASAEPTGVSALTPTVAELVPTFALAEVDATGAETVAVAPVLPWLEFAATCVDATGVETLAVALVCAGAEAALVWVEAGGVDALLVELTAGGAVCTLVLVEADATGVLTLT